MWVPSVIGRKWYELRRPVEATVGLLWKPRTRAPQTDLVGIPEFGRIPIASENLLASVRPRTRTEEQPPFGFA